MTKNQEMAVTRLKDAFFKYYCYNHPDEREFKEVFVEEWADTETVYVRLEMGLIDDEGTMAEWFCRDKTAVCIGKRGGYFSFRNSTGKKCTLSLLEAITWGTRQTRKNSKKKEA